MFALTVKLRSGYFIYNFIFTKMVNISTEDVIAQKVEKEEALKKSSSQNQKKANFDENNYLDTRLAPGQAEKEIVIRLLPFSNKELSPFKKVYVHSVKITNEDGKKVWKKFMCPIGMHKDTKCPFCETSDKARKMYFDEKNGSGDQVKMEQYSDVEFMNRRKDYWLVRCIDRAHEDHGPKFWRFPDARNGEGIWDKMYALFEAKKKRGVEIFDLYNGKDLIITVKRTANDKLVYQIQDDEKCKPLSNDEAQMEKWVNDPKSWEDVYSIKDYDYLSIIVQGGVPVFSKNLNRWISKNEADKIDSEAKEQELQDKLRGGGTDFSSFTVNTGKTDTEKKIESVSEERNSSPADDLPF